MQSIVKVSGAGIRSVNGSFMAKPNKQIPAGFDATCKKMSWPTDDMWERLAVPTVDWYEHQNGSYIYLHTEGRWWIDDPSGAGVYVAPVTKADNQVVPSTGWEPLSGGLEPLPTVVHIQQDKIVKELYM